MIELRNVMATCISKKSNEVVLHEVVYEIKEGDDEWLKEMAYVMAKDPMDAIEIVREEFK